MSVDLLQRLNKDLDALRRYNAWDDNELANAFKKYLANELPEGYRKKHEEALREFKESHGLPLTVEEYESWRNLLRDDTNKRELYYDVYTYHYLKELHEKHDHLDEVLERFERYEGDRILRERRDLLIDGLLTIIESDVESTVLGRQSDEWRNWLGVMNEWLGKLQNPSLVVIWRLRISVLESLCKKDPESLSAAVKNIPELQPASDRTLWLAFRYRQTKDFAEEAKQTLSAHVLRELDKLIDPSTPVSPDNLAKSLEYALIGINLVERGTPEEQRVRHLLELRMRGEHLAQVRTYFTECRKKYLRELATRPAREVLAKFTELTTQVGRIHRALKELKRNPDQTAEINPLLFGEILEGIPNQTANGGLRNITEKLEIVVRGLDELRNGYIKLLTAHDDAILGQQTWNLGNLSLSYEAQHADADLDKIAECDVIYETRLFNELNEFLKGHFKEIDDACKGLNESLSQKCRQQQSPLKCYREAKKHLDAIEIQTEIIRNTQGFKHLLDLHIFRVPDAFVKSEPRVTLDKYYHSLVGLEEHKRIVRQLIERTEKWETWKDELEKTLSSVFADKKKIEEWDNYIDMLIRSLPTGVSRVEDLDDDLYGTTSEWLERIKGVEERPEVDARKLESILNRLYEIGDLSQAIEKTFGKAPGNGLPEDLVDHYTFGSDLVGHYTFSEEKATTMVELERCNELNDLKTKLVERARLLAKRCDGLRGYLEFSKRIIRYIEEEAQMASKQARKGDHRINARIRDLNLYKSVLQGSREQT